MVAEVMNIQSEEVSEEIHQIDKVKEINVFQYSPIVPNPQSSDNALIIRGLPEGSFDLKLFDLHGRQVTAQENYNNDWLMNALNPGMYVYRITSRVEEEYIHVWMGKLMIISN